MLHYKNGKRYHNSLLLFSWLKDNSLYFDLNIGTDAIQEGTLNVSKNETAVPINFIINVNILNKPEIE